MIKRLNYYTLEKVTRTLGAVWILSGPFLMSQGPAINLLLVSTAIHMPVFD